MALRWLATGCHEPEQAHIILAEPHASEAKLAAAERELEEIQVRLREQIASVDEGITITLRQVTGEPGAEVMSMLNKLSGIATACETGGFSG